MAGIGIMTAQARPERAVGQIHVYDGLGKGKSQAALGVVLRSLGLGMTGQKTTETRVLLVQFLKGYGREYAEDARSPPCAKGFPI